MEGNYVSIRDMAEAWNISLRQMQMYCKDGRIPGAKKVDNNWLVPGDSKRPENFRNLTGEERRQNFKWKSNSSANSEEKNHDSLFLNVMYHEVRNTLNAILGYSELIEKNKNDLESITNYTSIIQSSGNKMLELVNNISDLNKLYRGEFKIEEHVFNIETLISKLVLSQKQDIGANNLCIENKTMITNEFVYGDETKILKILSCIFSNSIKFSEQNKTINISVLEEPLNREGFCKIHFKIEDQGIGIPEQKLKLIQKHLKSGLFTYEHEYPGIGLITAKQFTDFLGGNIDISSSSGIGTTVSLNFDFRKANLSTINNISSEKNPVKITQKLKGRRILITDDNEINREIAKEVLSSVGIECECAEDGIICIAMLEQHPENYYDLILMDLQMPNVDGILATVLIRRLDDASKRNIPIVAMTANVQTENKEQALKAGMNGFVEKPFRSENLFKVLENCIFCK